MSGRHVSNFIRSSSGPLRKQIQELSMFQCTVGSQMLTNFCYRKVKYISLYTLNFIINIYKLSLPPSDCSSKLKCRLMLNKSRHIIKNILQFSICFWKHQVYLCPLFTVAQFFEGQMTELRRKATVMTIWTFYQYIYIYIYRKNVHI